MADLSCTGGEITLSEIVDGVNGRVDEEGGTMTGTLVVPQITLGGENISPYSNKNALVNTSFRVNQREFDGNWAGLATDEYGYDRWKKTAGGISQIIPDTYYTPSTAYTLSGNNIITSEVISPSTGDWAIEVPVNAGNIQLEKGHVATSYDEPHLAVVLAQCKFFYEVISWNELPTISVLLSGVNSYGIFSLNYSEKYQIPTISFVPGSLEVPEKQMAANTPGASTGQGTNPVISTDHELSTTRAKGFIDYASYAGTEVGLGYAMQPNESAGVVTKTQIIIDSEIA